MTARVTPTAAARSMAAANSSGVVAPHASRCVWASTVDVGNGSGGGGGGFTGAPPGAARTRQPGRRSAGARAS